MIIEGRVAQILEPRTGKRTDGTEWKILPFIIEYFEHETDMTPQSVMEAVIKILLQYPEMVNEADTFFV